MCLGTVFLGAGLLGVAGGAKAAKQEGTRAALDLCDRQVPREKFRGSIFVFRRILEIPLELSHRPVVWR